MARRPIIRGEEGALAAANGPGAEIRAEFAERREALREEREALMEEIADLPPEERRAAIQAFREEKMALRQEKREALDELRGLTGDPDRVEPSDLDASESFDIAQNEDGTVTITSPWGERTSNRPVEAEIETFEDLASAIQAKVDELRETFDALKALTGDPDALEPSDLDASDDFAVTESRDGFVVLEGPNRSTKTQIAYGEDTDTFEELAVWRENAIAELMALTGDSEALEASDLDASEDFFITESEDGMVVINYIARAYETNIEFSEETDSFVELAEQIPAPIPPEAEDVLG